MKHFAAVIPAIVGALALLGWSLGIDALTRLAPNFVAMNPVTALCTMASSAALLMSHAPHPFARAWRISLLLSSAAALCATLKLMEIAFGWQLGVDTWISHAKLNAVPASPAHPRPATAHFYIQRIHRALWCQHRHCGLRRPPPQLGNLAGRCRCCAVPGEAQGQRMLCVARLGRHLGCTSLTG